MKKLLYIFTTVLIVACSNEPVFSSDDGLYRWSFKLDGQLYEWEGTLSNDPNNLGASLYGDGLLTLVSQSSSGSEGISVTCMFPTINTGNFTFDSTDNFQISFNDTNLLSSTIYSTILYGGQINVNILKS